MASGGSDPFFGDLPPPKEGIHSPHPVLKEVDPSFRFVIRGVLWFIYLAVVLSVIFYFLAT
jgi:hypothetical protein